MTHDINSDPEMWELRELHGDRAGFVWLECLSIADRNSGVIGPNSPQTINQLASKCRTKRGKVSLIIDWMISHGWIEVEPQLNRGSMVVPLVLYDHWRVAKWTKYNKTRESDESPSDSPPPPTPKSPKKDSCPTDLFKPEMSVQDFVDSWNANFRGRLPLVEWPLSTSRHRKAAIRLKEHKSIAFWTQVFTRIGESNFLLGSNNGSWRCTFDFLINNDSNCIKIYEGAYSRQR